MRVNESPSGDAVTGRALVSLAASIGALLYAPIAGEVHVYWNQWIDFPYLALPWLALVAVALLHGLRVLGEAGSPQRDRALTWISLGIVATQVLAGVALLVYLLYGAWNCEFCLT
jgi:hypothetical protein